jgi:L-serine dehydratase
MEENNYIDTSVFDIFKIGPGPSSSHTIGPMKAGNGFREYVSLLHREDIERSASLKVELHGSLSATGRGHGTHRAVAAGIIGWTPESCDPDKVLALFEQKGAVYAVDFDGIKVPLSEKDIIFCDPGEALKFPYANTLIISLLDSDGNVILSKEYYSIGGGFIKCKDESEPKRNKPKYLYSNFNELRSLVENEHIELYDILLENEMAITGRSEEYIMKKMKDIVHAMIESVENGLEADENLLPGPIGLQRKAKRVHDSAKERKHIMNRYMIYLNSYALAASEENAAGKIVVTAPTSGSSGLIPGIIYFLNHHMQETKKDIIKGMFIAASIGFIARTNASIAGAEVGCQGEVGVAAAMGAALMAAINNEPISIIENSASIALEHMLGLTCDPVGGYVQVPCIERNAAGALEGYNAYYLAFAKHSKIIRFDEIIETMLETGRDMNSKYRETAKGGLATVTSIRC